MLIKKGLPKMRNKENAPSLAKGRSAHEKEILPSRQTLPQNDICLCARLKPLSSSLAFHEELMVFIGDARCLTQ
jgi:hypothetical protein